MAPRQTRQLVTFLHPFHLDEIEDELPAGSYEVDTEEERLDGPTFNAFRRVSTVFVVRPSAAAEHKGNRSILIDPSSLEAALERDMVQAAVKQTAWNREVSALSSRQAAEIISISTPQGDDRHYGRNSQ